MIARTFELQVFVVSRLRSGAFEQLVHEARFLFGLSKGRITGAVCTTSSFLRPFSLIPVRLWHVLRS